MSSHSMLEQEKFWNIIKYLVQLDHKMNVTDVCNNLEFSTRQLNSIITFLKEVNFEFDLYEEGEIE